MYVITKRNCNCFFGGSVIESTTLPVTISLDKCQLPIVIGNVIVSISFRLQITKLPISALRFSEHDRYGVPDIHAFGDLWRGHVPLGLDELYSLWFGRFGDGRCQRFELWWGFGVGVGQVGDWHVAGLELAVVKD